MASSNKSRAKVPAQKPRKARAASTKSSKAAKPVKEDGLLVIKAASDVPANTPLGKAIAQVTHMQGGGPNADTYFGRTEKGGKPVYAIRKTGQRSGSGESGSRHVVTLHTVDKQGKLSKPLARAKSVRAGWVFSG